MHDTTTAQEEHTTVPLVNDVALHVTSHTDKQAPQGHDALRGSFIELL